MPNRRIRKRPRTSSTMSTVSPSTTFNTVAVTALAILKRLVARQRLADGLAGLRVPGFAGSELKMTVRFWRVLRESRAVRLSPEMQRVVLEQRLGFVATVTAEGRPNLSPKGTTTLWDEEHLMFADLASPGTIENLATNPHVEINVVDPIPRKGYRFKGTAAG